MAIRKSMEEVLVIDGERKDWLLKCVQALESNGFKNVIISKSLFQVSGTYKKITVWGEILITLFPEGEKHTKIIVRATSNVDNIYALFKSPNKTIIAKFKEGIK